VAGTHKKLEQLGVEEVELQDKMNKLEKECEKSKAEYQ
jgi:hypothetical protein